MSSKQGNASAFLIKSSDADLTPAPEIEYESGRSTYAASMRVAPRASHMLVPEIIAG
jgi:hypothetical protein